MDLIAIATMDLACRPIVGILPDLTPVYRMEDGTLWLEVAHHGGTCMARKVEPSELLPPPQPRMD